MKHEQKIEVQKNKNNFCLSLLKRLTMSQIWRSVRLSDREHSIKRLPW